MQVPNVLPLGRLLLFPLLLAMSLTLSACGGGGGGNNSGGGGDLVVPAPPPPEQPTAPVKLTSNEAGRFLSQATFGPNTASIADLIDKGVEQWLVDELEKPASLHLEKVLADFPEDGTFLDEMGMPPPQVVFLASDSFWQTAIEGDDQLRQRMAFALSQILVISAESDLGRVPQTVAHYMDILTEGAFGNYRDLLENVTYSPAMSVYLTYLRNEKANAELEHAYASYVAALNADMDHMKKRLSDVDEKTRNAMVKAIERRQASLDETKQKLQKAKG